MFSNTLSFLSSRNVNDQVSHPYKTTGKIIVLYSYTYNKFKYLEKDIVCNLPSTFQAWHTFWEEVMLKVKYIFKLSKKVIKINRKSYLLLGIF